MSCAIVFAMRLRTLQLSCERLGVGRPVILAAVLVLRVSLTRFVSKQDGLNNTLVQQQEEMGGAT